LAKPNYSYEKRQKELAKQRKKQEKLQRKVHKHDEPQADEAEQSSATQPASGAAPTQNPAN
jgi:hypothetical protein